MTTQVSHRKPHTQAGEVRRTRNRLVEEHLGLAEMIAADYRHRGVERDDLRQVAFLALVKTAERFDPDRGIPFSAFASVSINGELKRHFRDQGWSVRPPRSIQEAYLSVRRAQDILTQQLARSPTVDELADYCEIDEDAVLVALTANANYQAQSLEPRTDDGPMRSIEPTSQESGYQHVEDEVEVAALIEDLSERDRRVLSLRFWDGLTQSEVAARIGVSQVQVSRMLHSIADRIRNRTLDHTAMSRSLGISRAGRG